MNSPDALQRYKASNLADFTKNSLQLVRRKPAKREQFCAAIDKFVGNVPLGAGARD